MSITTKGGDQGTTSLLFGRRVPKNHPRVEAYGAVDELSAALGMVRAAMAKESPEWTLVRNVQEDLIVLMGETAVHTEDYGKWMEKTSRHLDDPDILKLEEAIQAREAVITRLRGFDLPGENELHARCHVARTICRRAERALVALRDVHQIPLRELLPRYLNRLSDLLWLIGREALGAGESGS